MGEMADIMAALANVKDVNIDPATGKVLGSSGKNLLEKAGVKTEDLPASIQTQVKEAVTNRKEKTKDFGSYMDAYRGVLGIKTQQQIDEDKNPTTKEDIVTEKIEENIPKPTGNIDNVQQMGHIDTRINYKENESDYMAEMIKNIKKRKY